MPNGIAVIIVAAAVDRVEIQTGWKRTKLYRHLREHAEAGRAVQVSRGRTTGERSP
jgi:hypothetical protein